MKVIIGILSKIKKRGRILQKTGILLVTYQVSCIKSANLFFLCLKLILISISLADDETPPREPKQEEMEDMPAVRQSLEEVKKSEKMRKIQRIKTEKMITKMAQDSPEKLGEASQQIITRLDDKMLQRNNLPEEISPAYKKQNNEIYNSSVDKSSYQ